MRDSAMKRAVILYLAMTAIAAGFLAGRGDLAYLIPPLELSAWAKTVSAGLGVGLVMVLLSRLATARFAWAAHLADEFRKVLGPLDRREALIVAALSSLAEEALFRGLLQPSLGLWLTAAIFGVLHIGPTPRFLPWTVMAFAAGLAFGALALWTGNIFAPILAHATVNYLNLRFLVPEPRRGVLQLSVLSEERFAGL
jgi:uncharacterized protein